MSIELVTTAYGPPAHEALAEAVARAKQGDPLAAVTVVVPANTVGVAARRRLGRHGTGGRRGIAGARFVTPYGLAELVGAHRAAGARLRPVSTPAIAGAVRAALRSDPGHFAGVHTHPATERALVQAHRELSELTPAALDRLAAASTRAADVVRVHRQVRLALDSRFSNEQSLVDAAVEVLRKGEFPAAELGRLVLFLPQALTTTQSRLLVAVAEQTGCTVVAGMTGVAAADEAVRGAVESLGAAAKPARDASDPGHDPERVRIISVSDPDEEVRHAVRTLVEAARRGLELGRCAILYGTADPYARLVGDALDRAGISWVGATVESAETSLLGRSLLAMLSLADHDFGRRDVMAWLASAPVLYADPGTDPPRRRPAPSAAWERAARGAGVTGGRRQWQDRLSSHAQSLQDAAAEAAGDEAQQSRSRRLRREADSAESLAGFVTELAENLDVGLRATRWSSLAAWCRRLVNRYFGDARRREGASDGRGRWPEHERRFAVLVEEAIDRLGHLDEIDDQPSVASFRRALQMELEGATGRRGAIGRGVLTGQPSAALGADLDLAVVCGLAEGSFPARRHEDPLLPDRERITAGHDLPLRAGRNHDDHRALLAVLAAARETLLLYPRGDLRQAAERAPSRWLLDLIEAREGIRPATEELARSGVGCLSEVPSFVAGLRRAEFPAQVQEYDMATLLDWHHRPREEREPLEEHWLLEQRIELRRGVRLTLARRSRRFTRFDGNLSGDGDMRGVELPHPCGEGQITSPTRLENWAECPHAYFVRHVLGVDAVEDPDERHRITALDRGNLVHRILDRWLSEAIDERLVPAPTQGWLPQSRRRLEEIAEEECERLTERGMVGRRLYWERDRRQIIEDLRRTLVLDTEMRARHGSRPIASELQFAMPGSSSARPVVIDLGPPPQPGRDATGAPASDQRPRRRLALRGSIDRVDETASGDLAVIDYKTGSARSYQKLTAEDPTPAGGHLQLVLYALAARQILDRPDAAARGDYWFVSQKGGFVSRGYTVGADTEATVLATVAAIAEGIGAGVFPLHPEEPGWRLWIPCRYCEPDGLGTRDVWRDWERKQTHPDLRDYTALVVPELAACASPGGGSGP